MGIPLRSFFSEDAEGQKHGLFTDDLQTQLLDARDYHHIRLLSECWRRIQTKNIWWAKLSRGITRHLYTALLLFGIPFLLLLPLVFIIHGRLLRTVWYRAGATGTELFQEWLNEQLRSKLNLPENELVKFRHLSKIPLRIIAADLSKGQLRVFGRPEHEDMGVAEAVSASIAFPFFFRPKIILDSAFVDGGMVSNFPAWVLDDIRAQQVRIYPTFGFRLLDPPGQVLDEAWPGDAPPGIVELVRRLIFTAQNSRESLESRQIDDYHPITLQTHIRTLDFHLLCIEGAELVRRGQEDVERYFRCHLGPPREREEMELALRGLAYLAQDVTLAAGMGVRAYLLQRTDEHFCRVVYSGFYEGDADDALQIRWKSSSQVLCLHMREPVLMRVRDIPPEDLVHPATKYLHALRPQYIRHVYCIPIFENPNDWSIEIPGDRSAPIAALCLDFDDADDLLLLDPAVEDWTAALAQAAGEFWRDSVLTGLPELSEPLSHPSSDWRPITEKPGYYLSDRKVRGPLSEEDTQKLARVIRTVQSSYETGITDQN